MARFHISRPARADLSTVLATSLEHWGEDGRARYAALLAAAMQAIARRPHRASTRQRTELGPGLHSFHIRNARHGYGVRDPVHVIYYRVTGTTIEIVRVLHERMEPSLHLRVDVRRTKRSRRR